MDDILVELSMKQLHDVLDLYKNNLPYATYAHGLIKTVIRWKKIEPNGTVATVYSPEGDWTDGTIIVLLQCVLCDVHIFTLDKTCRRLYDSLSRTKRIDYSNYGVLFYAINEDYTETVEKIIKQKNLTKQADNPCYFYYLSMKKTEQFTIEIPAGYSIKTLEEDHAAAVNESWRHRYDGSENFIRLLIRMNGGKGLFAVEDNKLIGWVLINLACNIVMLEVTDHHRRKGIATLLTKSVSLEILQRGCDPMGTVLTSNTASQNMFKKLGFNVLNKCSFIECEKKF